MTAFPLLSVVIVNYNGKSLLGDCLASLCAQDYPEEKMEIVVVDNGSNDDSEKFIATFYPRVKIIKNDVNNYCKANNMGIKKAKGEFVVLLNNDTRLTPTWLKEMLYVMRRHTSAGAACGKILFADGKIQGAGHIALPHFYWADRGFKEEDKGQYDTIEDINSISHCAALFRKKCLHDVGPLDEDFIMYLEDVDMSLRTSAKGWKLLYVPTGVAYHKFHGSIDDASADFFCERNRLLLLAKHFPEKLPDELLGKGYFADLSCKKGLLDILPSILEKITKHHGQELAHRLLPGIFTGAEKVLRFAKDTLIKQITQEREQLESCRRQNETETSNLKETIAAGKRDIALLNKLVAEQEDNLKKAFAELTQLRRLHSQAEKAIVEKDAQITSKNAQLLLKEQAFKEASAESRNLKNQMDRIYGSETYRFIARPIWKILDLLKGKRMNRQGAQRRRGVLVIKPFCVAIEDAEAVLSQIRQSYPEARVSIFANVADADYERLKNNEYAEEKYVFSAGIRRLTILRLCKALLCIRNNRYDLAIVPIAEPVYHGYRKAKLFAFLCGARETKYQRMRSAPSESLGTCAPVTFFGKTVYSVFLLSLFMALFVIGIVIPLKLRKIFQR